MLPFWVFMELPVRCSERHDRLSGCVPQADVPCRCPTPHADVPFRCPMPHADVPCPMQMSHSDVLCPMQMSQSDVLCPMQMSPQDEGVGEEPECVVYCHSWQRHAPAPETPSRQETGTTWDPMPASPCRALQGQHGDSDQYPPVTCSQRSNTYSKSCTAPQASASGSTLFYCKANYRTGIKDLCLPVHRD